MTPLSHDQWLELILAILQLLLILLGVFPSGNFLS